ARVSAQGREPEEVAAGGIGGGEFLLLVPGAARTGSGKDVGRAGELVLAGSADDDGGPIGAGGHEAERVATRPVAREQFGLLGPSRAVDGEDVRLPGGRVLLGSGDD